MDQINKAVLLDCQRRVVHQVYVPVQHESGWATLSASYQRQAHDLAKAAAAAKATSAFPFLCMLELFKGRVCVQLRVVLSGIYEVAAGFGDLLQLGASPDQWWADWSGPLEGAVLQQPEVNLLIRARLLSLLRLWGTRLGRPFSNLCLLHLCCCLWSPGRESGAATGRVDTDGDWTLESLVHPRRRRGAAGTVQ